MVQKTLQKKNKKLSNSTNTYND